MLNRIEISNFALIDNVDLEFKSGYAAITGETGAGKSILLKALNLLLGARADHSVIGNTDKKCILEAEFDISALKLAPFFKQHDIDFDQQIVLRREFGKNGKSRLFINDSLTNLSTMKALGDQLVKVHTQHETLDLFDSNFQLETIDAFAKQIDAVSRYKTEFLSYKNDLKKIETLRAEESENRKEQDYITFLLNEFEAVNLASVDDDLFKDFERIQNWTKIKTQLQYSLSALQNGQEPVTGSILKSADALSEIQALSSDYAELNERLASVRIELNDIESELESQLSDQDLDDEQVHIITEKVEQLNSLFYKHNVTDVAGLIQIQEALSTKLLNFSSIASEIEALASSINTQKKALYKQADALCKKRQQVIPKFQKEIGLILAELGMPNAELKVDLTELSELNPSGTDRIDFLFKTNLGGQFLPVSKTASGGELSRLMLTILHIIADTKKLPTLIFDEIDTGVSGDIAAKMANLFAKMGENSQLISITHLPQVAGRAQTHYHVSKSVQGDTTSTQVLVLNADERINELAKMMSGETVTTTAIANAKLLLND